MTKSNPKHFKQPTVFKLVQPPDLDLSFSSNGNQNSEVLVIAPYELTFLCQRV